MRSLEESLFWEVLYRRQAVRSELAQLFAVSAATISRSAGVLLSNKLLIETSTTLSVRGRRPAMLQVNPDLAYVAGIEMDRDRITAVVTDITGNLLGRGALAASARNQLDITLRDCRKAVRVALADAGLEANQLAGIGVGHTGTLDVESGVCLDWEGVPHWRKVNLRAALQETFGTRITLDDRARAVALAEHLLCSENRRHRSAIYVQIGTGIGAGIFVNGRMLRGATRTGGEIGHITIDRNGPLCACGRKGCVEAFASLGATIARVRSGLGQAHVSYRTADAIVSAARRGDPLALAALAETGEALGLGIANAIQLLNPSLVVLAGKFANSAREFLLEAITRTVREHCSDTLLRALEIRVAPVRKDTGPVGCALLASLDIAAERVQRSLFVPHAQQAAL